MGLIVGQQSEMSTVDVLMVFLYAQHQSKGFFLHLGLVLLAAGDGLRCKGHRTIRSICIHV